MMNNESFDGFMEWAVENDLNLGYPDVWQQWYDCWLSGYKAGLIKAQEIVKTDESLME